MTLINTPASFPSFMWAVTRLLLTLSGEDGKPVDRELAKLLLTPPTLPAGETNEFRDAVRTLADLGIVTGEAELELAPSTRRLSPDDVADFYALLRRRTFDTERNVGLENSPAEKPDLEGPKDLVRALAWFLTQDPLVPRDWEWVAQHQRDAFPEGQADPFTNETRWIRFGYWAPALGMAAVPLLRTNGKTPLLPDCATAVRETALALWKPGETVPAGEVIAQLLMVLPVLPGGKYSRRLGLRSGPENQVSPALSQALLAGEADGWLELSNPSDAKAITLSDRSSPRGVQSFTIQERV